MDQLKMDHGWRKGRKCCVAGCNSIYNDMYRFPRSDPQLFQMWLKKTQPPFYEEMTIDEIYRKYSVCADHFPVESKVPGAKRGLTRTAVPTLKIPEHRPLIQNVFRRNEKPAIKIVRSRSARAANQGISSRDPYQFTCRVCLERSAKLYPLQGKILHCDMDIYRMIAHCVGEEVELSDDLPRNVCISCFKTIRICYNFINQYKTNQQTLINDRLERIKIEQQTMDETEEGLESSTEEHQNYEETDDNTNTSFENTDETQMKIESVTGYKERASVKFEKEYESQEEEEETALDESLASEETILLDLIKQDNVEVEDADVEQTHDGDSVSEETVYVIPTATDNNADNPGSSNEQMEVDVEIDDGPDSTKESVFRTDHNYINVSNVSSKTTKDVGSNDTISNLSKFIKILPKTSDAQKVLITPLTSTSSLNAQNLRFVAVKPNVQSTVVPNQIILKTDSFSTTPKIVRFVVEDQKNDKRVKKKVAKSRPPPKLLDNEDSAEDDQEINETSKKGGIRYPCPICPNVVFVSREAKFRAHILMNHQHDTFECKRCSLGNLPASLYMEHFMTSHRFECIQCNKRFKNKHNLVTHMRRHLNIRHYCTYPNCKKSFAVAFGLRKHLEEHTGEVKYPCEICGHISSTYDTHNYHVRMHGGRKYLCPKCGQTFLQASHLTAHMWKHTGKKYFKCDQCNNSYTSVGPLRKHQRKYHPKV